MRVFTFSRSLLQKTTWAVQKSLRRFSTEHLSLLEKLLSSGDFYENNPDGPELLLNLPRGGKNVLLVHPMPARQSKLYKQRSDLLVEEAKALIETLPHFRVASAVKLGTENERKKLVFGSGNVERIAELIQAAHANAVMVNVSMLTGLQHSELEERFKVSILDRYTVVLNIFRFYAKTKEAKLQIALAEIPYYRSRLRMLPKIDDSKRSMSVGGETYIERCRLALDNRQSSLQSQLEYLQSHRQMLRKQRQKLELPVVAVVGYTNAGKTSLIKKMAANEQKLEPKDRLFATLDVTLHAGRLPSSQRVLYADTVGFIQDIPTALVASFAATLEDVLLAQVVIHVRDLSHPDTECQKQTVLDTLRSIGMSQTGLDDIIELGNKIDIVQRTNSDVLKQLPSNCITTNAVSGIGVGGLLHIVDEAIQRQRSGLVVRVLTGGEAYSWLYKNGALKSIQADEKDYNYSLVEVSLTAANRSRFICQFVDNTDCKIESDSHVEFDENDEFDVDTVLRK